MFSRFTLALRLLCSHFPLIAALVLTVWLPGNAVVNYLVYCTNASESTVFRLPIWIETLFSPIYTGGVIYALARISDGYRPRYGEALGVGLRMWIPLFGARLVAGL
ncbi:MAG: hypothetical protein MUF48_24060, partial [Pirellulaceae bacterium]|nr:hypothetical protein [Pirellulaceae bacterium]